MVQNYKLHEKTLKTNSPTFVEFQENALESRSFDSFQFFKEIFSFHLIAESNSVKKPWVSG